MTRTVQRDWPASCFGARLCDKLESNISCKFLVQVSSATVAGISRDSIAETCYQDSHNKCNLDDSSIMLFTRGQQSSVITCKARFTMAGKLVNAVRTRGAITAWIASTVVLVVLTSWTYTKHHWIGLCNILLPRQHSIGYMGQNTKPQTHYSSNSVS